MSIHLDKNKLHVYIEARRRKTFVGVLEFKNVPGENLEKLKKVSLSKREWSQSKLSRMQEKLEEL